MPPDGLAAKQKVACDVHRVAQRQVLIDHLDPLAAGVGGRGEPNLRAVDHDPSLVGNDCPRQNLAQRRFSRPVVADEAKDLAGAQDRD